MIGAGTPLDHVWPYAAAVAGVLALALAVAVLIRFGNFGARRPAAWKYAAERTRLRQLLHEQRYDEAAAMVGPLLRRYDISSDFFDIAAIAADRRGRPAEAMKYWLAMPRNYPADPAGYVLAGRMLLRQGKLRRAYRLLERGRTRVGFPPHLDVVLAEAAQAAERWDEAIARWAELRVSAPGEISGYLEARKCLLAVGRREEADALLTDVAARMPGNPLVKAALAAARKAEGS